MFWFCITAEGRNGLGTSIYLPGLTWLAGSQFGKTLNFKSEVRTMTDLHGSHALHVDSHGLLARILYTLELRGPICPNSCSFSQALLLKQSR